MKELVSGGGGQKGGKKVGATREGLLAVVGEQAPRSGWDGASVDGARVSRA